MKTVYFAIAIHSHQPTGNFDHVFEQAYADAYQPFLDLLAEHPDIPFTFHYSGCLLEWLEGHHPDFIQQLKSLVARGQVEIMGGGFYEPILSMLTEDDIQEQVTSFSEYLERLFGARPQGAWLAERVWEQTLARLLADAGIKYTVVDDTHFLYAGLREAQLTGYFLTEDQGRLLAVFPGSEKLRYAIPFSPPETTLAILKERATEHGNQLVVYADDGEKFGVWPGTKKHVYDDGWLRRFFNLLEENRDWIRFLRLREALETLAPVGKIYLPDASYREMTEWALPAEALCEYEELLKELKKRKHYAKLKQFLKGGFWRNFKVKYPEANLLYAKMMHLSRKVKALPKHSEDYHRARRQLHRGQCNCAYWHGVFGGLYLPHLRSAAYGHLIAAERLADEHRFSADKPVCIQVFDFDMDGTDEVHLSSPGLGAYLKPNQGGALYELDIKKKNFNLLASLARRPEAYHKELQAGAANLDSNDVKSIHDIRLVKNSGLEKRLVYDSYPRQSLLDHFYPQGTSLKALCAGEENELGDFVQGNYGLRLLGQKSRAPRVELSRLGTVFEGKQLLPVHLTKTIELSARGNSLQVSYVVHNQADKELSVYFGIEFNFALLAGDSPASFYHRGEGESIGSLSLEAELEGSGLLTLRAEVAQIDVLLLLETPARFWCFPVRTISHSEAGLELIYQSSVVIPHWQLQLPPGERWSTSMKLETQDL